MQPAYLSADYADFADYSDQPHPRISKITSGNFTTIERKARKACHQLHHARRAAMDCYVAAPNTEHRLPNTE
jgi:hypothetical protein